jgi:hypothetical protein
LPIPFPNDANDFQENDKKHGRKEKKQQIPQQSGAREKIANSTCRIPSSS